MDLLNIDACTLPTLERPLRLSEFDALFRESLTSVEQHGDVAVLHLTGRPGLVTRIHDLTDREADCCTFFGFEVEGTDDDLALRITVTPERADVLTALVTRAQQANA
ncbi:hypothetical protein [Nocardioides szechwanensis]|nr:hypothetical protein [Nocardioides szechwanensis]